MAQKASSRKTRTLNIRHQKHLTTRRRNQMTPPPQNQAKNQKQETSQKLQKIWQNENENATTKTKTRQNVF